MFNNSYTDILPIDLAEPLYSLWCFVKTKDGFLYNSTNLDAKIPTTPSCKLSLKTTIQLYFLFWIAASSKINWNWLCVKSFLSSLIFSICDKIGAISFVNNNSNIDVGTNEAGFKAVLTRSISEY